MGQTDAIDPQETCNHGGPTKGINAVGLPLLGLLGPNRQGVDALGISSWQSRLRALPLDLLSKSLGVLNHSGAR
jgi:hypothetical protein